MDTILFCGSSNVLVHHPIWKITATAITISSRPSSISSITVWIDVPNTHWVVDDNNSTMNNEYLTTYRIRNSVFIRYLIINPVEWYWLFGGFNWHSMLELCNWNESHTSMMDCSGSLLPIFYFKSLISNSLDALTARKVIW